MSTTTETFSMNMPALTIETASTGSSPSVHKQDLYESDHHHHSHSSLNHPHTSPIMDRGQSHSQGSSHSGGRPRTCLSRNFTDVLIGNMKFLIMDCPTDSTLLEYKKELLARGVTDVVRVCQPTYDKSVLEQDGIQVHDWPFADGGIPPNDVIMKFLKLCDERFGGLHVKEDPIPSSNTGKVAVHCVAGLGRAPFLVVVTLIEAGMAPLDAVEYVRKRRRGALNSTQLQYVADSYKRQYGAGKKHSGGSAFSFLRRHGSPSSSHSSVSSESSSSHSHIDTASKGTSRVRASLARVFRLKRPFSSTSSSAASSADTSPDLSTACLSSGSPEPRALPLAS